MQKVLIIGAGTLQLPAIVEAKRLGLRVAAFDANLNAPGFDVADEAYQISTVDIASAVSKAKEIAPDGVMTLASDFPLRTVAAIAAELNLEGLSEQRAYVATNKARMREAFDKHGVPIPWFFVCNDELSFIKAASIFRGRQFIVKPADSSGSRGVHLCDDHADLAAVYSYARRYSRSGEIVVEEYMTGPEVSVEAFALNGDIKIVAVTDKITTHAPYFVEMGHTQPSSLGSESLNAVCEVAKAAMQALDIFQGPAHIEIIVTDVGPKIVELGARLGGDYISTHLVPLSTGVNLVSACVSSAMGMEIHLPEPLSRAAAIRYVSCSQGIITGIHGVQEATDIPGIQEVELYKNIGESVNAVRNSTDRVGHVIASGESVAYVVHQCQKAIDTIRISVR